MSNTKRALQITGGTDYEFVKPFPPEGLWEKMDALHQEEYPENDPGFTIKEYMARYSLTWGQAEGRLRRMAHAGKLVLGHKRVNNRRERVYRFPEEK